MSRLPVVLLALLALGACDTGSGSPSDTTPQPTAAVCQNLTRDAVNQLSTPPAMSIDVNKAYTARLNTSKGAVSIQLNPKAAPVTVNNFVCLAEQHYYDGLTFHRVVPGFVVQGGDPLGNGTGGPAYKLPNETNPTPWKAGSVGMASSPAGRQRVAVLHRPRGRAERRVAGHQRRLQPVRERHRRGRRRPEAAGRRQDQLDRHHGPVTAPRPLLLAIAFSVLVAGCGYPDPGASASSGGLAAGTDIPTPTPSPTPSVSPSPGGDDFNAGKGLPVVTLPDGLKYIDIVAGTGAKP